MIWHYTIGPKLPLIAEDKALKPTSINTGPGERPILWCSSNPWWEKSCAKKTLDRETGSLRWMTHDEHVGLLLCRFRIPARVVTAWPKVARQAGMSSLTVTRLERTARDMGADPRHWSGTPKRIPLRDTAIECFEPDHGWISIPFEDALAMGQALTDALNIRMEKLKA